MDNNAGNGPFGHLSDEVSSHPSVQQWHANGSSLLSTTSVSDLMIKMVWRTLTLTHSYTLATTQLALAHWVLTLALTTV